MPKEVLEGSEVGERKGLLNLQPRAQAIVALIAVAFMVAPASVFAATPSALREQDTDTYIERINSRYGDHVDTAAMLTDYDRDMIVSVITVESEGNPRAASPVGARGLMQLMPGTAKIFGVKDLSDPFQNILAGTKYLKDLETNYGFKNVDEALIAYNMGPARARRFLSQYDTADHSYVKKVKFVYNRIQDQKRDLNHALTLRQSIDDSVAKAEAVRPVAVSSFAAKIFSPMRVAEASTSN
ncbi:MAG TPA: lytic transglycosylase domain-containing protein [Candidatus Paceibacterota bacterium]|nr:lytic transglycosylase domain-containing protein [Candidatus Paceibacterota bacterium]